MKKKQKLFTAILAGFLAVVFILGLMATALPYIL